MAGLPNREDDVVGQLRQEQDVGDVVLQRVLEQLRGAVRGEQDDRRTSVLADRCDLVHRQRRGAGGVQDDLEVPTGQGRCGLRHLWGGADELDLRMVGKRLPEIRQAVAVARHVDAGLLPGGALTVFACPLLEHYWPPPKSAKKRLSCARLRPSRRIVPRVVTLSGLSAAWTTGRSWRVQPTLLELLPPVVTSVKLSFWDCWSVTSSMTG